MYTIIAIVLTVLSCFVVGMLMVIAIRIAFLPFKIVYRLLTTKREKVEISPVKELPPNVIALETRR